MNRFSEVIVFAFVLPLAGCAALRVGAVGEIGALRAFGSRAVFGEGALVAGSASVTASFRVASVVVARSSLFQTGGHSIRIVGSVSGKPVARGLVQARAGEIILRDPNNGIGFTFSTAQPTKSRR